MAAADLTDNQWNRRRGYHMRRCPVCGKELTQGPVCDNCGFDFSRDYEGHRTLCSALPKGAEPVSVRAAKWKRQKQLVPVSSDGPVCPKCGGQQFYFLADEMQFQCADCGWIKPVAPPKDAPSGPDGPGLSERGPVPEPEHEQEPGPKQEPKPKGKFLAAAALVLALLVVGIVFLANRDSTPPLNLDRTIGPTLIAGSLHIVGLKSDGTVVAVGSNDYGQLDVDRWTDIVAVAAGGGHTVGLKSDGTVVAVGANKWKNFGECDVDGWTDIVAVDGGNVHTVGLKSDGTVVAVGDNEHGQCDVGDWTNIVAIAADWHRTVGIRSNGTVVATGLNDSGECNVSGWRNITAAACGTNHTVGLKSDGTVVATGDNGHDRCDVGAWTDIVAVAAGEYHTVGLKSDGTVVATGENYYGECDVGGWTDIVAITAGWSFTVGLKSDGTVVAVGNSKFSRYNGAVSWTDILLPDGTGRDKVKPIIGVRDAEERLMSMTPAELGLPGKSMSQYEVFPQNGTELVNGMPCIRLEVYNSGDGPDPYVFAGSYLMGVDGARLYKVDPITNELSELDFTPDP